KGLIPFSWSIATHAPGPVAPRGAKNYARSIVATAGSTGKVSRPHRQPACLRRGLAPLDVGRERRPGVPDARAPGGPDGRDRDAGRELGAGLAWRAARPAASSSPAPLPTGRIWRPPRPRTVRSPSGTLHGRRGERGRNV